MADKIQKNISDHINFAENEALDADDNERKSRHLSTYIRAKLGISLADYARTEGVPVSTLHDRWNSADGRVRIENAVFRFYVERFEDL